MTAEPRHTDAHDVVHSHNHSGGCDHGYGHAHGRGGPLNFNRAFAIGVALNLTFVVVEAVFGILSNSLALVADAGHNLSDVVGLLLAWGAAYLAGRLPSPRRTYGFRRVTIVASLASGVLLLVALGVILREAIDRFAHPVVIRGGTVIAVASVGFVINAITAALFMRGREHDLNIRGAFLHMTADAAVSLGVVVTFVLYQFTGWTFLDPLVSTLIVLAILVGTWGLLKESFALLIDEVPARIDPAAVEAFLLRLPDVTAIHDLHIWAMSTTELALSAHLETCNPAVNNALLQQVEVELMHQFGISHPTVQLELNDSVQCRQAEPGTV